MTVRLANAWEIGSKYRIAAVAPVLSEFDGIFTVKEVENMVSLYSGFPKSSVKHYDADG